MWKNDPAEFAVAIARIERDATEPGVMPPPEARQLDAEAREQLLEYLRRDPLAKEPDARLVHAAERGMRWRAAAKQPDPSVRSATRGA